MKTNKALYRAAFRPVHTSGDFWMEVQMRKEKSGRLRRRPVLRAAMVAAALALCAVTAFAVSRLLSAGEVAHEVGNEKLEQALQSTDAVVLREVQTFSAHRVTLLGLVSGTDISGLKLGERADEIEGAHTYCVLSVERTDGNALGADGESFLLAPWISGQAPDSAQPSGRGSWTLSAADGRTEYYILDTDALAPYAAAGTVWIGVQDGGFFGEAPEGETAFFYDAASGAYRANSIYRGVNALFDVTPYLG